MDKKKKRVLVRYVHNKTFCLSDEKLKKKKKKLKLKKRGSTTCFM